MSANYNFIVTFQIHARFQLIRKPDSFRMVFKSNVFIDNVLANKNWKQN